MTGSDPAPTTPALLSLSNIRFGYGDWTLFNGLSLSLRPARALVLIGSNGSGKSTLLRLMAGLIQPDRGAVERAMLDDGDHVAISWLGHALGLKNSFTVGESLQFHCRLNGSAGGPPLDEALARVGLPGFAPVSVRELSAGQRKRVALAGLLVAPTPVWLLDEPHANLDPAGHTIVDELISGQLARGGTVALSVHHPDLAAFAGARDLLHVDQVVAS